MLGIYCLFSIFIKNPVLAILIKYFHLLKILNENAEACFVHTIRKTFAIERLKCLSLNFDNNAEVVSNRFSASIF